MQFWTFLVSDVLIVLLEMLWRQDTAVEGDYERA